MEKKKQIGDWIIERTLGKGGFGTVFKVRNKNDKREAALKEILKVRGDSTDEHLLENSKNNKLSSLRHENLVALLDKVETEDAWNFIYEICDYGSLQDYWENTRECIPLEEVKYIGREIACGLSYLEQNNVIHRDVKPANILMHRSPNRLFHHIKVSDFGTSTEGEGNEEYRSVMGTPAFLAPETKVGAICDNRVDVWGFGMTLLQLIIEEPVYTVKTSLKQLTIKTPFLLPYECLDFFNGCLQNDPAKRFSWNQALSHPFLNKSAVYELVNEISPAPTYEAGKYTYFLNRTERLNWVSTDRSLLTLYNSEILANPQSSSVLRRNSIAEVKKATNILLYKMRTLNKEIAALYRKTSLSIIATIVHQNWRNEIGNFKVKINTMSTEVKAEPNELKNKLPIINAIEYDEEVQKPPSIPADTLSKAKPAINAFKPPKR